MTDQQEQAPETDAPEDPDITVALGNAIRTSAGSHQPGDVAELPADEARALLRSGHAVRTSGPPTAPRAVAPLGRPSPSDRPRIVNGQKVWAGFPGYTEEES